MKRRPINTRLFPPLLVAGWLAALVFLLWVGSLDAARSEIDLHQAVGAAPPPLHAIAQSVMAPAAVVTCTNTLTTTADTIGEETGNITDTAASLAPYFDLSLVGTVGINQSKATFPEYFRLDNAVVGASYKIEAVPNATTNYNLGILVYDRNQSLLLSDVNTADFKASVTLAPTNIGPYYVKVFQASDQCRGGTYDLDVTYTGPTSTPVSPTPTTVSGSLPDRYDNPPGANDTITKAAALGDLNNTGLTLCNLAYCNPNVPNEDWDWYVIYAVSGYRYTVSALTNGAYPILNMRIYKPDKTTLVGAVYDSNAPSISWDTSQAGNYYVHIWRAAGSLTNGSYSLNWNAPGPTVTPTPGPEVTETPVPGLDAYEPNYDFEHAASIGLNVKYTGINFVPLPGQSENNDYFKARVKRGMLVTCETLDLSPGTDTNMILYDNDLNGLAGNDDVDTTRGELRSRVTVSINYDGFLYILVGQGYAVPDFQASLYNYALQCTTPGNTIVSPTASPPGGGPTRTPAPPPTSQPSATTSATPMPPISVRALPPPTPAGPARQMVTADLRVYYDVNKNSVADPGEGVVGLPVRVYDEVAGALLAQGFTDESGRAVFTVPSAGPIRVVVPYLDFQTIVPPSGAAIPVLISPRELPSQIP